MTNFNHSAEHIFEQAIFDRIEFAGLGDHLIRQVLQRGWQVLAQVLVRVMDILVERLANQPEEYLMISISEIFGSHAAQGGLLQGTVKPVEQVGPQTEQA